MSKFLLNTANSPTNQIITLADVEFLRLSEESLIAVSDPADACPSDAYLLIANQNEDNIWSTSWMLRTEYETIQKNRQLASRMKTKRNALLAASDWTQGKDIPTEISNKWVVYRQALRDITAQAGFPLEIEWPEKP